MFLIDIRTDVWHERETSLSPMSEEQWQSDLASWAIPDEILAQAPQSPWIHPVAMFTVSDEIPDSFSHQIAREVNPNSVLDVGSGGGRASMALVPPAKLLIAVDHQQGMLDEYAKAAEIRGVEHLEFLGDWPDVAADVPEADVVVCHHVAYNVPNINAFLVALNDHAAKRVVIEVPQFHPLTYMNPLWKRFWNLDRPTRPTAEQLRDLALALGFNAQLKIWEDETWGKRVALSESERVQHARIRLCLSADRDEEVAVALAELPESPIRNVATLWWDVR